MKSVKSLNPCKSVIQTKEISVKAQGSELKVKSMQGEGTTLTIQFPVA